MERFEQYARQIVGLLDTAVRQQPPDAVLLSGGIDSSAVAYLAKKHNSGLASITVVTRGAASSDREYARAVAHELRIERQIIAELRPDELPELVPKVAIALGSFNIYWVSAALVLFKGLDCAKAHGLKTVATGEGADDIFGSFPVMINWKDGDERLEDFIRIRLQDIDVMAQRMADYLGVRITTPFHDENVVRLALSIPLNLKIRKNADGTTTTKYALRESFRGLLPEIAVERPQTMAFTGASTIDLLKATYEDYADREAYRRKYNIAFGTGLECFLFDVINAHGSYVPVREGNACLYCHSKLRARNSVHCTACGTLQYKKHILQF